MVTRWSYAENCEVDLDPSDYMPECLWCGSLYDGDYCKECDPDEDEVDNEE